MEPEALCRFRVIITLCKLGMPVAVATLPALELAAVIQGYIFMLTSYSRYPHEDSFLGSDLEKLIEDLWKYLCVGLNIGVLNW